MGRRRAVAAVEAGLVWLLLLVLLLCQLLVLRLLPLPPLLQQCVPVLLR
jgi:hypothetical protein